MVVIPLGGDQPYCAERCAALGVARVIAPHERTPERIRAAVRAVLADPGYRARAEEMRRAMLALPDTSRAVPLLETLARTGTPLLREPTKGDPQAIAPA